MVGPRCKNLGTSSRNRLFTLLITLYLYLYKNLNFLNYMYSFVFRTVKHSLVITFDNNNNDCRHYDHRLIL